MSKKIKLIWDFRGSDALETAKHHVIHLKEFSTIEKRTYHEADSTQLNEMLAYAFIIINEEDMSLYRDALKPHRGELT